MGDLKTQYQIEITRTGSGSPEAVAEFQKVDAAARAANAGLATTTAGLSVTQNTAKGTAAAFKALNPVLTLIGLQSFPQLASAGLLTKSALDGVRASGVSLNASLATTSAGVAGLIALVIAAGFAWSAYKAQQEEALTKGAVDNQTKAFGEDLKATLTTMREEGEITITTFERLVSLAGSLTGNQQIRDFIKNERRGNAQQEIAALERLIELEKSKNLLTQRPDTLTNEFNLYNRRIELIKQLRAEQRITQEELIALSQEAEIKWNATSAAIANVKKPLTQLQQLGQQVAETFASQLSGALVNVFKEGGKALQNFAAQFFATVAQMIMQALIMRALFGATGASTGTGGLIGGLLNKAATGGFFPRMMASGGMQGVSEVSTATLFPRFNVVAGEAGREMMTVLARPRFMAVGGMQAVVGNAGSHRLAITNADELAARGGAGAGGRVEIQVNMHPDLRAEIVNESVKGAMVSVTNDMGRDSKLSRTTKQLR